jgi:hypothetical protein
VKKIPALLYVGKGPEYKPFRDFRLVPSTYYQPGALISNHGRACTTQALLLYRTFSRTLKEKRSSCARSLLFVGLVYDARYTKRINE